MDMELLCYRTTRMIVFNIYDPQLPPRCDQSGAQAALNSCGRDVGCISRGLASRGLRSSFILTWPGYNSWASLLVQSCKANTGNSYTYLTSTGRSGSRNAAEPGEEEEEASTPAPSVPSSWHRG